MSSENNKIETIRHSLSHIMAAAVKKLYPDVKLGIGPAIENGFYYDFDGLKISDDDLPRIEEEMRQIIRQNIAFAKSEISQSEAEKIFADQPYKLELINELCEGLTLTDSVRVRPSQAKVISIYKSGNFTDLCIGPHIKSTEEISPGAFKLSKIAGAYWRGDEKRPMLTRVYGLAFETEKELADHLKMIEEAEKRDHRKIGAKLDLFSFHEQAPGMPFFHPRGAIVYHELEKFWRQAQEEFDYQYVHCPSMLDVSIWKQSGHWDHYKEDMFFIKAAKDEKEFALRPMDCPGAILVYNNSPKSYRDLPLRYAEPGLITRKEKSGQLGGLFRVQQFKQDDAHIFMAEDQIESEIKSVIKLVDKIYKPFGLEYKAFLSTRPDDYMGDIKLWDKAEKELTKILKEVYGDNYGLKEKDGAFYGPKIDYQLKDCLGRTWQCATIQLDFQMPLKFDCQFIDNEGKPRTPVMIHRTIMGSFERFMGILIEHYAGAFPLWLSPVQAIILPIGQDHQKYGQEVLDMLKKNNIRATLNLDNETIGKKIREAEMQKIPYLLVVGDKEVQAKSVAVRERGAGDKGAMAIDELIDIIKKEVADKN
ncbi:MAG: threonine--tRNA ligase [Candidatus Pacebacteria bacterium]|nr:threonine--tRNA ligase [Candidatus Paceibacterota bacterium]